jgi:hypothetical protein
MRRLAFCLATLGLPLIGCNLTTESSDSSQQGATAQGTVCSDEVAAQVAERMLNEPVRPPRILAGLDLAGGDSWPGLEFRDATRVLCQATELGSDKESGTTTVGWGQAAGAPNAFTATYNNQTKKLESWQLNSGYRGKLDFESRPSTATKANPFGHHTYSIGIGTPVLRDGKPWNLVWSGPDWDRQATELYDALMYTYAPEMQGDQVSCIASQTCLARAFATGEGVFGVRPLGVYLYVPDTHAAQPAASSPEYLYGFYVKLMPFSRPDTFLKLDAEGPVAEALVGELESRCVMKLGQTFKSFVDTCVTVLATPSANEIQKQKLLGGAHINPAGDTWIMQVEGVAPNFSVTTAGEGAPALGAVTSELVLDVRASGKSRNEYSRDGQTFNLGATAAIYREYARLVQGTLHAAMPANLPKFPVGAPECLMSADANNAWQPARGCTGMEAFITPAEPDTGNVGIDRVSVGAVKATRLGIRPSLKATTLNATFCADPGTLEHCFGKGDGGATGALFSTTAERVTTILGDATPEAAKTPDFYIPLFAKAVVKYLRAAALYPTDLSKPEYASFEPADGDIVIQPSGGPESDLRVIKYKNAFQLDLLGLSSLIVELKFKR